MALVATVSYSKKVPAETEYSSQGYSLSLETEIPDADPAAIQRRLHETFELVKSSVEQELAGSAHPGLGDPGANSVPAPRGNGKASNKQIKYITDLAARREIDVSALNELIRKEFGVEGLYGLDKRQASAVVDRLKKNVKKAA